MKVICIKDTWNIEKSLKIKTTPSFGSIYTVIDDGLDRLGQPCYELAEFKGVWAKKTHFAPLSNIDETELAEQRLQTA